MRLISTKTLDLEELFNIYVPEYAILSYTWSTSPCSSKVTEIDPRFSPHIHEPGFQKIIWTCKEATRGNLQYVWVDTNYIDKTSSAELSETINSMFKWHRQARMCTYQSSQMSASMTIPRRALLRVPVRSQSQR
ncbi:hypothetical protein CI102_6384 [Trichoderma harzianum]|nr:hypothetical protein CI102_6384 [Trichoderma harzianum]